jgi:hypothetical protein
LAADCADGFRAVAPPKAVAAHGVGTFELPAGACARVLVVGQALQETSLRQPAPPGVASAEPHVLARSGGPTDAVLPAYGPFCTAKPTRYEVENRSANEATFVVFATP